MKTRKVTSKSWGIADTEPIVLRDNNSFRLVFKPEIIENNNKNPNAKIKGEFWFQRKDREDNWEDHKTFDNTKLKAGEYTKLHLSSEETHKLFLELKQLYELAEEHGARDGEYHYVPRDSQASQVLRWLSNQGITEDALSKLTELDSDKLANLHRLIDVSQLRQVIQQWNDNRHNSKEEFWQQLLTDNAWLISQLFATPILFNQAKAYVGGKQLDNKSGRELDFLYKNEITKNVALIEIKTPTKKLVKSEYRQVHSIAEEVTGGIVQLQDYRQNLLKQSSDFFEEKTLNINAKCYLIVGDTSQLSESEIESFEKFRTSLNGVEIITFDELFKRTEDLLDLFEGNDSNGIESDDLPF